MRIWHKSCTFLPGIARLAGVGVGLGCAVAMAGSLVDLKGLADPTRPYTGGPATAVPAPEATGPMLQSTMISPTDRRAVISGRSYRVGDKIDGAVITDIQPYEVTLKRGNRVDRLRMLPRLVKDPKALSDKAPGRNG